MSLMRWAAVADAGFLEGGGSVTVSCVKRAQKFRSHTHFQLKPRPFSIVLERDYLP